MPNSIKSVHPSITGLILILCLQAQEFRQGYAGKLSLLKLKYTLSANQIKIEIMKPAFNILTIILLGLIFQTSILSGQDKQDKQDKQRKKIRIDRIRK